MSFENPKYSIVLHAGAAESWHGDAAAHENSVNFLRALIEKGKSDLHNGTAAVDVVTEITAALEDYPDFNAGKGSALNLEGFHELEAAVIDGKTCEYRAAVGLRRTKNPVRLARSMLSSADLCFLAGSVADDLAARNGLELVENSHFTTPKRKSYWDANVTRTNATAESHGTVGAAALDVYGNLAAANSTGGTMFKSVGRVGDTAIVGAGLYADDEVAIVCSGSGEAILKATVASRAAANMHKCDSLSDAIKTSVLKSAQLFPTSSCGVIAVNREGDISTQSNSRIFAIASAGSHTSTRAGVIGSTIPLLTQHIFFADRNLTVGVAKYPTMPYQVTAEIKQTSAVASLGLELFLDVLSKLRIASKVLKQYSGLVDCGLVMSTATEVQIYPFTSPPHFINRSTPSKTESSLIITHRLDDTFGAAINLSPEDEDILARIYLIPKGIDCKVDFVSLPSEAFYNLLKLIWDSLQTLVVKHNKKPSSLRFKLEPVSGEGLMITVFCSESTSESPMKDPRPAPFRKIYAGHMATGLSLRAQNLEELPFLAQELLERMRNTIDQEQVVLSV